MPPPDRPPPGRETAGSARPSTTSSPWAAPRATFAAPSRRSSRNTAAWPFLEDGSYQAIQDKLLEEEEEVKLLLLKAAQEPQQPEAATANEASQEHGMQISQVYSEPPSETNSVLEKSPVHETVLPFPPATSTARLRSPTHGWISTDSESESELDNGEMLSAVPNPVESLLSKRKRPSRWDECPNGN